MLRFQIFKVKGHSMSPDFVSNSFVLSIKHPWQSYSIGDVVLVNHNIYGKMIKQIVSVYEGNTMNNGYCIPDKLSKKITLKGSHPDSVTTEQMGEVDQSAIIGKVVYQIKPPTLVG